MAKLFGSSLFGLRLEERDSYPALRILTTIYFDQDYDEISLDPAEVVEVFKFESEGKYDQIMQEDVRRFVKTYGTTDEELEEAFRRIFYPTMGIYGWNGGTLREALRKIADIFADPGNPGRRRP